MLHYLLNICLNAKIIIKFKTYNALIFIGYYLNPFHDDFGDFVEFVGGEAFDVLAQLASEALHIFMLCVAPTGRVNKEDLLPMTVLTYSQLVIG